MLAYLDVIMFAVVLAALLRGYHVAFTLAGVGLAFAALADVVGHHVWIDSGAWRSLGNYDSNIFGNFDTAEEVLLAVPLFVFMGVMLERSQIATDLLETMGRLFGPLRGGLGLSVTFVGMLLAASTGIVGATVVTMGLISLPAMLKNNYSKSLACGSIAASGTLGQIIPPSIVLVILGEQISNAYTKARNDYNTAAQQEAWANNDWSFFPTPPAPVSVGDLFAGALIPGLLLVGLYLVYQIIVAIVSPKSSPAIIDERGMPGFGEVISVLAPPILLIFAVLGSILGGVATPTESAALGALGAILLAGARSARGRDYFTLLGVISMIAVFVLKFSSGPNALSVNSADADQLRITIALVLSGITVAAVAVALIRTYSNGVLSAVMTQTTKVSAMVFMILIGARLFSMVFRALGGEERVHGILSMVPDIAGLGPQYSALIVVMIVIFILGFFLDFLEIVFIVVPMVAPVLFAGEVGLNPVWVAILIAINLQTSFLTPPFGFALFYLRGVAPPSVTTMDIYKGVIPFVLIQLIGLGIVAAFPTLATWLPSLIFG